MIEMPDKLELIEIETPQGKLGGLKAGQSEHNTILLVHGWPLTSAIWEPVIPSLAEHYSVIAFDLPGIGRSRSESPPTSLSDIAAALLDGATEMGARNIIMVGVDVGGMIAFSAARQFAHRIRAAVIINTVLPGIAPWDEVIENPQIWHFAFHQIPELPELLVAGHQRRYFDFFLDVLSGSQEEITPEIRQRFAEAYDDANALKAGFDWYRAMPEAAKENVKGGRIDTPLLYLRGDADHSDIAPYLEGLRKAGAQRVTGKVIADSGEIIPLEQPSELVVALMAFAGGIEN